MITRLRTSLAAVVLATLFLHTYKIAELPMGLYLDESSIGLNAATMATSGRDEHGHAWPVYFQAFGEYKNPVYIYTASALFRIFGVSDLALRLTSALFFLAAFGLAWLLVRRLFPLHPAVQIWALAALGTLPHYMTLSRISFEVISQIPFMVGILLLAFHYFQPGNGSRRDLVLAAGIGVVLGASIYTYSTARLLNPLLALAFVAGCLRFREDVGVDRMYLRSRQFAAIAVMGLACAACLVPYLYFAQATPEGLTGRFRDLTYLDDDIPVVDKLALLLKNYLGYWTPHFLLFRGDNNLRHSIGYGGVIFVCVYGLGLFALGYWWRFRTFIHDAFVRFFLLSWLIAPVAAATINEQHALRSATLGLHWVIASAYGLHYLGTLFNARTFATLFRTAVAALAVEAGLYAGAYFVLFPERSLQGSESYDVARTYQAAVDRHARTIWFIADPYPSYANMRFHLASEPEGAGERVRIRYDYDFIPAANECVIYPTSGENRLPHAPYALAPVYEPAWLERLLDVPRRDHITRLKCY